MTHSLLWFNSCVSFLTWLMHSWHCVNCGNRCVDLYIESALFWVTFKVHNTMWGRGKVR